MGAVGLTGVPEEIEARRGVLILRTEGEAFCGPERRHASRLRKLGQQVYARFVRVADLIDPFYAAILVEYSL